MDAKHTNPTNPDAKALAQPRDPRGWGVWIAWPDGSEERVIFREWTGSSRASFWAARSARYPMDENQYTDERGLSEVVEVQARFITRWEQPAPGDRLAIPFRREGGAP